MTTIRTLEAQLMIRVSMERQQLRRIHSLSTRRALHRSRTEGLLNGFGSLAEDLRLLLVLLAMVTLLLRVRSLVETRAIELLVA